MDGFKLFCQRIERAQIPLLVLFRISRSGSFFFHGLYDNHPEVLSFPGAADFFTIYFPNETQCEKGSERLGDLIRARRDSRLHNLVNNLGENKDKTIDFDETKLAARITELVGNSPSRKALFLAFHWATGEQLGRDLSKVKMIFLHEHSPKYHPSTIPDILLDFPDAKFICLVRDPRGCYASMLGFRDNLRNIGEEEWANSIDFFYDNWQSFPILFKQLDTYWKHCAIVRLEDVQASPEKAPLILARLADIEPHPSLEQCTYNGFTWWGDIFTMTTGYQTSASKQGWQTKLSSMQVAALEMLLEVELRLLHYPTLYCTSKSQRLKALSTLLIWTKDNFTPYLTRSFRAHLRKTGNSPRQVYLNLLNRYLKLNRAVVARLLAKRSYQHISDILVDFDGATKGTRTPFERLGNPAQTDLCQSA